jgi:hypothetical protein
MAKPNYKFDKRQRDIAKKKQQDEKRLKKLAKTGTKNADGTDVVESSDTTAEGASSEAADTSPGTDSR